MIVIIAAAIGVLFFVVAMYACLVVGSQMDDEMTDLYQHRWEVQDGDKRDETKKGQAGSADDRTASGKAL